MVREFYSDSKHLQISIQPVWGVNKKLIKPGGVKEVINIDLTNTISSSDLASNNDINKKGLLGPTIEKDSVRVMPQLISNCTTRNLREATRDLLPKNHFKEFHQFKTDFSYENILNQLKVKESSRLKFQEKVIDLQNNEVKPNQLKDLRQLNISAYQGDIVEVKKLIEQGLNVNAKSKYEPGPLISAVVADQMATAKLLLDSGANVNIQGNNGTTPLMLSTSEEMKKLILAHNPDLSLKDNRGRTANFYHPELSINTRPVNKLESKNNLLTPKLNPNLSNNNILSANKPNQNYVAPLNSKNATTPENNKTVVNGPAGVNKNDFQARITHYIKGFINDKHSQTQLTNNLAPSTTPKIGNHRSTSQNR